MLKIFSSYLVETKFKRVFLKKESVGWIKASAAIIDRLEVSQPLP